MSNKALLFIFLFIALLPFKAYSHEVGECLDKEALKKNLDSRGYIVAMGGDIASATPSSLLILYSAKEKKAYLIKKDTNASTPAARVCIDGIMSADFFDERQEGIISWVFDQGDKSESAKICKAITKRKAPCFHGDEKFLELEKTGNIMPFLGWGKINDPALPLDKNMTISITYNFETNSGTAFVHLGTAIYTFYELSNMSFSEDFKKIVDQQDKEDRAWMNENDTLADITKTRKEWDKQARRMRQNAEALKKELGHKYSEEDWLTILTATHGMAHKE